MLGGHNDPGVAWCLWLYADTDHPLLLVRPFLELPRWQLEAACAEQGLTWANDPTNDNTAFLRNHIRALLSKPIGQATAQQDLPQDSQVTNELSSPRPFPHQPSHQPPILDQEGNQLQKQALLEQEPKDSSNCEPAGIIPAILQVHRRCAAAHAALTSDAISLLQASLQLPQRPLHGQQSRQRAAQQAVEDWSLAVKPFAEARSDVALHALAAVMQARFPAAVWVKKHCVSIGKNTGCARHFTTLNGRHVVM